MNIAITPQKLRGCVTPPPSKSDAHRLLIAMALADKPSRMRLTATNADIEATMRCLNALGAQMQLQGDVVAVTPIAKAAELAQCDCGESGSTLRFLLPIMAACGGARFTGKGRLSQRPLTPIYPVLEAHGCCLSAQGEFPLSVSGRLQGRDFEISGSLSSQFVSGLLMAAPLR